MKGVGPGLAVGILALVASVPAMAQITSPFGRCEADKLRAVGRGGQLLLACQAKRALTGVGESSCFIKANLKLRDMFDKAGGCAGDIDTIIAALKPAMDAAVFEILPEQCALQADMDGFVSCAQHPDMPVCDAGCRVYHFDTFNRRGPLYFCLCG